MSTRIVALWTLAIAILLLVLPGCKGSGDPSTNIFVKKGSHERTRIAVLPFANVSRDQEAGGIVTNAVITYLLSTGQFDVVEPGVVNTALTAEGIRLSEGLSEDSCSRLRARLNTDAFLLGLVEEYGEVRVGTETYPSISFSARLINAQNAQIIWAGVISKTGDENISVFDIGRVSSLGKLSKMAVSDMAKSLAKSKGDLFGAPAPVKPGPAATPATPATPVTPATTTSPTTPPAGSSVLGGKAKYQDESLAFGEKELTPLLKDVDGLKLGEVVYSKHYHDTVKAKYTTPAGTFLEVRLVDYRTLEIAKRFLALDHTDERSSQFEGFLAYGAESGNYPSYHLDLAVGRFGVYITGPKTNRPEIETLASGLIKLLK